MKHIVEELQYRKKLQYRKLMEFTELTEQLLNTVQRKDEVSAKIYIAMREEPLRQMQEINRGIIKLLEDLSEEEDVQIRGILNSRHGEESSPIPFPMTEEEKALHQLVLQYDRLLQKAQSLDRQVSRSIYGQRSFYRK